MKRTSLAVLALSLVAATVGCQTRDTSATQPSMSKVEASQMKLDTLPPSAKLAVLRETDGSVIDKTSVGEFEGHELYTINFTTPEGKKGRVQTLSDGRVLSREVDQEKVPAGALPPAVRQGIEAHTGHIAPSSVVKATWGEAPVYVARVMISGKTHLLTFDERGQQLKEQVEIDRDQIPVLAAARLSERFTDLKIEDVSEIRIGSAVFYEVIGDTRKAHITATMTPDGMFKSLKTDAK